MKQYTYAKYYNFETGCGLMGVCSARSLLTCWNFYCIRTRFLLFYKQSTGRRQTDVRMSPPGHRRTHARTNERTIGKHNSLLIDWWSASLCHSYQYISSSDQLSLGFGLQWWKLWLLCTLDHSLPAIALTRSPVLTPRKVFTARRCAMSQVGILHRRLNVWTRE